MTPDIGTQARTLVDLITEDGSVIPVDSTVWVIGYRDQRLIVDWDDVRVTGERLSATCNRWELWVARPRVVRP